MPEFPEPPAPAELARIPPAWHLLVGGTVLYRVYFQAGPHPTRWNQLRHYGPTLARFDHHELPPRVQQHGILYAARQPVTALAEVFQARRTIDASAGEPWLLGFRLARDLRLLDLTGAWPTRAGASMALSSGPRPRARRWSRAIYGAYPAAEGLWYPSSMHANAPAVALYERGADALPAAPVLHRALADPILQVVLENAALELGYGLVLRPVWW